VATGTQCNLHEYSGRSDDPSIKGAHRFSFYSRSRRLIALQQVLLQSHP
jgi:hypothetical protein